MSFNFNLEAFTCLQPIVALVDTQRAVTLILDVELYTFLCTLFWKTAGQLPAIQFKLELVVSTQFKSETNENIKRDRIQKLQFQIKLKHLFL